NSAKGITWSCRANTNYSLSIPDLLFIVSHHAYPDIPATTIARSQRECQDNRTQVQFQRRYSCCCHPHSDKPAQADGIRPQARSPRPTTCSRKDGSLSAAVSDLLANPGCYTGLVLLLAIRGIGAGRRCHYSMSPPRD